MTRIATLTGLIFLCLPLTLAAQQDCKNSIPASTPTGNFTINNDGTVVDKTTGLMWQRCSAGQSPPGCAGQVTSLTWQEALQLGDTSTFAGHSDWRLPNIKELASIVERSCVAPAVNIFVFPETNSNYWTGSSYANNASALAWIVDFFEGRDSPDTRTQKRRVRLVRNAE